MGNDIGSSDAARVGKELAAKVLAAHFPSVDKQEAALAEIGMMVRERDVGTLTYFLGVTEESVQRGIGALAVANKSRVFLMTASGVQKLVDGCEVKMMEASPNV